MKIKVGLIGFGRMGQMYWEEMQKSGRWDIAYICDTDPASRELARNLSPSSRIISDEQEIFDDQSVEAVGLFALANSRKEQIEKAVRSNKHILTEKPIADTIDKEWEIVDLIEKYDRIAAVNLYLRNSWYHQAMKQFIDEGEIGELAILRICHMTPGLAPGEGHEYEGPAYKDPWWVQCHGTFENGIAFDVTQGFVYGQLSRNQTHNAYTDIIGTKGIVRMTHDFRTAVVELHGVNRTLRLEKPFGGKNLDKLCNIMADSIESGKRDPRLPQMRDSAIASQYGWTFLEDARRHDLPGIGDLQTLEEIKERLRHMKEGYGLLRPKKTVV